MRLRKASRQSRPWQEFTVLCFGDPESQNILVALHVDAVKRLAPHKRVGMIGSRYADLIRASCQVSSSGQATQTGRTHDRNTCFLVLTSKSLLTCWGRPHMTLTLGPPFPSSAQLKPLQTQRRKGCHVEIPLGRRADGCRLLQLGKPLPQIFSYFCDEPPSFSDNTFSQDEALLTP